ncbi:MAG: hypothetical protein ACOZE5_03905 [Verrucomicrobiota bacterium]
MPSTHSELTRRHLEAVREYYAAAPTVLGWAARGYRAWLAHYYNLLIPADASVLEIGCGAGDLLGRLKARRCAGVDGQPVFWKDRKRRPGADRPALSRTHAVEKPQMHPNAHRSFGQSSQPRRAPEH